MSTSVLVTGAVLIGPTPAVVALVIASMAAAAAAMVVLPAPRGGGGRRLDELDLDAPPVPGADGAPESGRLGGIGSGPPGRATGPTGRTVRTTDQPGATDPTDDERRLADRRRVRQRRAALVGLAAALVATLGWLPGLLVGVVGGVIADRVVGGLEPASERRRKAQLVEDLPAFADLLATTTRAGVPMVRAVEVCSHALGGPLGAVGGRVATALQLGADPARAWALLAVDEPTRPLAATMTRAGERGLAPTAALLACAGEARRARAHAAAKRSQAVGVSAAAPLGLCFLPAFVLLAVVPTVVGNLSRILG